jgi:hypothetical protein
MKVQNLWILIAVLVLYIVINSPQRSQNTYIVINVNFIVNAATTKIPLLKASANKPTANKPSASKPTANKPSLSKPLLLTNENKPLLLLSKDDPPTIDPPTIEKQQEPFEANKTINIRDYLVNIMETIYYSS